MAPANHDAQWRQQFMMAKSRNGAMLSFRSVSCSFEFEIRLLAVRAPNEKTKWWKPVPNFVPTVTHYFMVTLHVQTTIHS